MTNTQTTSFCKFFETELEAEAFMRTRNRAYEAAGNRQDFDVVVVGPENNWAVVDLRTAIEIGGGYRWAV